eukprot:Phypoly_transcript_03143.p1 GENE.Phypoly_transcript_03143~~Phypoly_transcript_03143.p1  ORF type:complete len:818 (+),score=151.04 Phypoly_transcript_03143:58-2511(+)
MAATHRAVADAVARKLHIHNLDDWYNVYTSHLKHFRKEIPQLREYSSAEALVTSAYPAHAWDREKFANKHHRRGLRAQMFCERVVRSIFPNSKIETNVRAAHGIIGDKGHPLEIDVFLPEISLGFEYQDPHHYFNSVYFGDVPLQERQHRDSLKQSSSESKGITIINVPFWWDWSIESLVATIKKKRKDLLQERQTFAEPLSDIPPKHVLEKWNFDVPDLGVPMLALHAPQAQSFDPQDWWIFEKFDGVRAVWHPGMRELYSRWGSVLQVPNFIKDISPSHLWLDGEIWFGRIRHTRYQALKVSSSKTVNEKVDWEKYKFMAFDTPHPDQRDKEFWRRYTHLLASFSHKNPYFGVATHNICLNKDTVEAKYFSIRNEGGEGVIIRDPKAPYVNGYSRFIYKFKGFKDAEAMVLSRKGTNFICRVYNLNLIHNIEEHPEKRGEEEIKGKEEAEKGDIGVEKGDIEGEKSDAGETTGEGDTERVGGDTERDRGEGEKRGGGEKKDQGRYFDVEMSLDAHFEGSAAEVVPGRFVSFKYMGEYNTGTGPPMNPKIYTVRHDIKNWQQVLHAKRKHTVNERVWKPPSKYMHWKDPKTHKEIFDKFAANQNFDPLIPENWYPIQASKFNAEVKGSLLAEYYNGSLIKALMSVYPNIGLKETHFQQTLRSYWHNPDHKRQFFDEFAKSRDFDPLVPENWYSIQRSDIDELKGSESVLKGGLAEALLNAYPFIGLDKNKFSIKRNKKFFSDKENRRKFFDEYAAEKKFDPLVVTNWYRVARDDVIKKGGIALLRMYEGSVASALAAAYPDLLLDPNLFIANGKNA